MPHILYVTRYTQTLCKAVTLQLTTINRKLSCVIAYCHLQNSAGLMNHHDVL